MHRDSTGVFITGGSRGLGLALARSFLASGHRVAVCGRDQLALDAAGKAVPGLVTLRADIAHQADREQVVRQAHERLGSIGILLNNAAICCVHDLRDGDALASAPQAEIDTNLLAPIELTRLVIGARAPGSPLTIVNVSTAGALIPLTLLPLYSATKAALRAYTAALRQQVRPAGIGVVELFPPTMKTKLIDGLIVGGVPKHPTAVIDRFAQKAVDGILRGDEKVAADLSVHLVLLLARLAPGPMGSLANSAIKVDPEVPAGAGPR